MTLEFGPRRARTLNVSEVMAGKAPVLDPAEVKYWERFDLIYRSLCAVLFNFVPMSGHPGGSISSGRFAAALLFRWMDYDVSDPERDEADLISYAAGHKALGVYAMWALRDEILSLSAPELLPGDVRHRLRLEDLLGFRRNPATDTPLFNKFASKPLDGHPTPATPFLKLATGASGIGFASSVGLGFAARDAWGVDAPRVNIVEGEGGMTAGRVSEAMAAGGTASLDNLILHLDWNQASIDSDWVCREGDQPGDYVQWDPREMAYLHDWNVLEVNDGSDLAQVHAAQKLAQEMDSGQPTAIVYRTVKGWRYGIEGKASHGGGHKFGSEGFYEALQPLSEATGVAFPACSKSKAPADVEAAYWATLECFREILQKETGMLEFLSGQLSESRKRLSSRNRQPRNEAMNLDSIWELAEKSGSDTPDALRLEAGTSATLRGQLGKILNYYNHASKGAILAAAADLLGSTSVLSAGKGFGEGFMHSVKNPDSRILSVGGICEDGISGVMSGVSAYGSHLAVASSYGAFMAALGHVSSRLHAIGMQSMAERMPGEPARPLMLICAHAGMKTGEDGPTHADPQALQLLQENFPEGSALTLTPWDPQELWPLITRTLQVRPALIAPFVTRPNENILDRQALGLAPAADATQGLYRLRAPKVQADVSIVLQGSGVTFAFLESALPILENAGLDVELFYVASAELFNALPETRRREIYPEETAKVAMGITGFTAATMHHWIMSEAGRAATLHPFQGKHFLGSGQADKVIAQAGLDGESQAAAVMRYVESRAGTPTCG